MHGTTNANIKNMIVDVTEGYKKAEEAINSGKTLAKLKEIQEVSKSL